MQLTYLTKAHTYLPLSGYNYLAIWYLEETSTAIRSQSSERLLNKLCTKDLQGCMAFSLNIHFFTQTNLIIQFFFFVCFSLTLIFAFSLMTEHVKKKRQSNNPSAIRNILLFFSSSSQLVHSPPSTTCHIQKSRWHHSNKIKIDKSMLTFLCLMTIIFMILIQQCKNYTRTKGV